MKKSILLASLIIIMAATFIFINKKQVDNSNENEQGVKASQDIDKDKTGIETIEADDYTILLKGSARPKNDEIGVEEAAEMGVEALEEKYNIDIKNEVDMIFLDDILANTGKWSGHINLSDTEKYEFLLDGKDGSLEFVNKDE